MIQSELARRSRSCARTSLRGNSSGRGLAAWLIPAIAVGILVGLFGSAPKAFTSCVILSGANLTLEIVCTTGHETATTSALTASGSVAPSSQAIEEVADANTRVDFSESSLAKVSTINAYLHSVLHGVDFVPAALPNGHYRQTHHFDRPDGQTSVQAFISSWGYLSEQKETIRNALAGGVDAEACSRVPEALVEMGKALHALQDAYSHSNYVDASAPAGLPMGASSRSEFNQALRSSPDLFLLSSQLADELRLTVYDPNAPSGDPEDPDATCRPGEPATKYCHRFYAKDYPNKNETVTQAVYDQAYAAAVLASKTFIADLAQELDTSWQKVVTYKTAADVCERPWLPSVQPSAGSQGNQSATIHVTGNRTHFVDGRTTVSLGQGIVIGHISVTSPTDMAVTLAIDADAVLGAHSLVVTTDDEVVTRLGGFAVEAPPPDPCPTGQGNQQPSLYSIVFDSDSSGRSQVCGLDLNSGLSSVGAAVQVTRDGVGQQQAQEPSWSLAASPVDGSGRIVYQFGATGVRGINLIKPDGTGQLRLTPLLNSVIPAGPLVGVHYPCADARDPAWSPDGAFVAYACLVAGGLNSNYDLWVHSLGSDPDNTADDFDYRLLTLPDSQELRPAWSPDGKSIAFVTSAKGAASLGPNSKIAIMGLSGRQGAVVRALGTFTILTDDAFTNSSPSWAPDGLAIAFATTRLGGRDIFRMSAVYGPAEAATFVRLTTNASSDSSPSWSPDGRAIAFSSNRSGTNQIYVMSALHGESDAEAFHQITTGEKNSGNPAWKPGNSQFDSGLHVTVIPEVSVASGMATPTGSGSVFVTDDVGHPVAGVWVTIVAPSTGTGTLSFAPSAGQTNSSGQLGFVVAEPTIQAPQTFLFVVSAIERGTGRSGSASVPIRVIGTASPVPGPTPIPPQERLPVGQPVFRAATKQALGQIASAKAAEGWFKSAEMLRSLGLDLLSVQFPRPENPENPELWQQVMKSLPVKLTKAGKSTGLKLYELQGIAFLYVESLAYRILANDPPDENYTTIAPPVVRSTIPIPYEAGEASFETVRAMNEHLATRALVCAYVEALATAVNRYAAAVGKGDERSAALQRNAILAFEDSLVLLSTTDAQSSRKVIAQLGNDGSQSTPLSSDLVADLQLLVSVRGFPTQVRDVLTTMGLSEGDIVALEEGFAAASPDAVAGNLKKSLETEASLADTAALTFGGAAPNDPAHAPEVVVTGGVFVHDGLPHRAVVSVRGEAGAMVPGSIDVTYEPGGTQPPVAPGTYLARAHFASSSLLYLDATAIGTLTITAVGPTNTTVSAASLHFPRVSQQATMLTSGDVLVSGGQKQGQAVPQSELFNTDTGAWTVTGSNVIPRFDHSATLLLDGRVLAVGGVSSNGDCSSNVTAEAYDPAASSWSLVGRLPSAAGTGHTATRLNDGRVLVAGGGDRCGGLFDNASIFEPSTNTWSATGRLLAPRQFHSAILLPDGRVLITGGVNAMPGAGAPSSEIFDPNSGEWAAAGDMTTPRLTSCGGYTQPFLSATSDAMLAAGGLAGTACTSLTPSRALLGISVTPNSVHFNRLGETRTLDVNATMSDGSNQTFVGALHYGSSDPAVATVDASGRVRAVGIGSATVTVTGDGVAPVPVSVTVEARHLERIVAIVPTPVFVGAGQSQSIFVNGQFSDGTQEALTSGATFSSSNANVVAVTEAGLITSGVNGAATVTVTVAGVAPIQLHITVKSLVAIVALPGSLSLTSRGQAQGLSITGQFSDGSQQLLTSGLSFLSSNPSVARVDLSGVVVAVANGTATITVSSPNVAAVQVPVTVNVSAPALTITKNHSGTFTQGQQGAHYTISVSNSAGADATSGTVSVTEAVPPGLTLVSMAGDGWSCSGNSCGRADLLAPGASYPTITATVNVSANASSAVVNSVTVSGGGSANATASDPTTILANTSSLSVTKAHVGSFTQGQVGASYTIVVSNAASAGATSGPVTVTDTLPPGLTLTSMAGGGWQCASATCTRSDALAGGATYPSITVTVNVAANATSPQLNTVVVSGGGSSAANVADSTVIVVVALPQEIDAISFSVLNLAGVTGGQALNLEADAQAFSVLNTSGTAPGQPSAKETDADWFSILNLAGATSGQSSSLEADAQSFSVLNTAGTAPGQPSAKETDADSFSILNLGGATGGQPIGMEANAAAFSVLNTTGETPSGQPAPMEADGRVVSTVNLAGGFGAPALRACYDGSLGTLPQAQGWTYSGDGQNPAPFVVDGLLHAGATAGSQYWSKVDTWVDFSQHVVLEARLRVNSSNYVPNVGTGTREGYYFLITNTTTGLAHSIGLSDSGFNIDSIAVSNQPLTPFLIKDGNFHTYRFEVVNGLASFSIDDVLRGSGFQPFLNGGGTNVLFGAADGASKSNTDLGYLCYSTTPR